MQVRIVQWNISNHCKAEKIAEYLQSCLYSPHTIICLQEVISSTYTKILDLLHPSCAAYSLDYRLPGPYEGKNRKLGVAVLGFGFNHIQAQLIDCSVFPERTLDCTLTCDDSSNIRVITFHSLTGVGYLKAKSSNFASIAGHMACSPTIDFACFDANEPRVDSIDPEKREFFDNQDKGKNAALLLGKNKVHHLEDALVRHLQNTQNTHDADPLAVSHKTGGIPKRYDYILSANTWDVKKLQYTYEESLAATSDHAAIVGDFKLL